MIYTLLVLGAAQGLFLAVLLATKRNNSAANKILAVAMLSFSASILESLAYAGGWYRDWPHIIGAAKPLIFVFGPILYLYALAVTLGGHTFRKRWLRHFIPAGLVALYFAPFYLSRGTTKIAFVEDLMRNGPPLDVVVIDNLQYPHGILYVVLTILLLRRHRAALRETHSNVEQINLLWLRNLTVGIVAVWALATVLHVMDLVGLTAGAIEPMLTPLAVSIMVYAIGYAGWRQPEIFHQVPPRVPLVPDIERPQAIAAIEPLVSADQSYEKSGLTQAQAAAHLAQLQRVMEKKQLYKNSLLTLQELADELSISPHHLSQVINTGLGKNFYDFVNGYRVEEIKRRLRDPKSAHLTILAIALDAGFNTKSSFNTFFKKHTGLTPSQYRAQPREPALV
jgi:AraC-like DNA-binding protein